MTETKPKAKTGRKKLDDTQKVKYKGVYLYEHEFEAFEIFKKGILDARKKPQKWVNR